MSLCADADERYVMSGSAWVWCGKAAVRFVEAGGNSRGVPASGGAVGRRAVAPAGVAA
jgi:hypothetical protein